MALVSNEILQQTALAQMHDIDNCITRLNQVKSSLLASTTELLDMASTLDADSPEMKMLERRRQQLAAYEKKIDQEIQDYQNKRKKAEARYQNASQNIDKSIQRMTAR